MVSLKDIEASNKGIEALGPDLVAVFVGATNGVGETTLKRLAKHALRPRVYVVGRSQEAADRILTECRASSNGGTFTFIKGDTSRMSNIDEICNQITHSEKAINILCLTIGTLQIGFGQSLAFIISLPNITQIQKTGCIIPWLSQSTHATDSYQICYPQCAVQTGYVASFPFSGQPSRAQLI